MGRADPMAHLSRQKTGKVERKVDYYLILTTKGVASLVSGLKAERSVKLT